MVTHPTPRHVWPVPFHRAHLCDRHASPHEYNGDINGHNHPAQQPSGTVHTPDRLTGLIEQVEAAIVLCAWNTRTPC